MNELEQLRKVADIAAFCCIDIKTNLQDAEKDWLEGKIPKGAFAYVMQRSDALHLALYNAGYTDNSIFDTPQRPK